MGSERRDDPSEPPPEKDAAARPEAAEPSRPGARLRRLRLERGLSLNGLSRLTHYSKGYLSKIETDEKALTPGVARRCDDALETGGELSELVAHDTREVAHDTREEEAEGADGEPAVEMCPYRGLAAYGPQDHRWFFGREGSVSVLLAWLTARLEGTGPLVVAAPSGAGKSSLLRAGLLPAIGRGLLPEAGSSAWPTLLITPGESPVGELLGRLDRITGIPVPVLAEALARDPALFAAHVRRGLNRASPLPGRPEEPGKVPGKDSGKEKAVPGAGGGAGGTGTRRLVLVVDQFEEVFTLCRDEEERRAFVAAAHALAARPAGDVSGGPVALVVLGLRADFYGHCLAYPVLVAALRDGHLPLGPMTLPELREVIVAPARAAGLTLEPGLVEILLRDMGVRPEAAEHGVGPAHEPGALPLLSHALLTTWQRREGNALTVDGYRLTGGIYGAVAATAERVYRALDAPHRELARRVLLRMVSVSADDAESRRPVDARHLPDARFPPGATFAVVEAFARARLLTVDADHVQLAHEALLRAWPRLREWILAGRAGLRVHQQLTDAAQAWEREDRDSSLLHRGVRLEAAQDWADTGEAALTRLEREFLQMSLAARSAENAEAVRRGRRLRRLAVTLTVLLVFAAGTTAYAVSAQQSAARQRNAALSQKVADEAAELRGTDPALAAQLSLASYRLSGTVESRSSLLSAFAAPFAGRLTGHGDHVNEAVFSADGRTVATAGDDGVRLWDVADPHRPRAVAAFGADGADVESLAFDPGGREIVTAGNDGSVQIWDVTDRRRPERLGVFGNGPAPVWSVAFGADGRTVATAGDDGVRLWDVADPRCPRPLAAPAGHTGAVRGVAFRPDGRVLASSGDDDTTRLWDVTDPRRPRLLASPLRHGEDVWAVAFSSDGRTLAVGGDDRTVRLWDVTAPRRPRLRATLTGHTGPIGSVAFSPDGRTLVSGGWDHTVRVWDTRALDRPRLLNVLNGHSNTVWSVAFSPDGRTLATGSWDHTARLWDTSNPVLRGHSGAVRAVAFSPDGTVLAAAGDDRKVRLWNVADPYRPTALAVPTSRNGTYYSVAFSPDGRTLAAAGEDETVRLWDITDRRAPVERPALTGHTARVRSVAFSPDGRVLASGGFDNTVRLWDVGGPGSVRAGAVLRGHGNAVHSVAFSPDGRVLASGGFDNTVRLWEVGGYASAKTISVLTGHRAGVSSVAFSADGRTLATAGDDRTVRLWSLADLHTPVMLAVLTGHTDVVHAAAFGLGGRVLVTGGSDHTVRLWDPDPERVANRICRRAHPAITRSEWDRYFPGLEHRPPCPAWTP